MVVFILTSVASLTSVAFAKGTVAFFPFFFASGNRQQATGKRKQGTGKRGGKRELND